MIKLDPFALLAAEVGRDLYEDYAGIGMDSGTVFIFGWQKAF
ncbi:hypothetical protein [Thalassomonas viridans]|nr:hypothetical protein [Thalassomonas viridans]